MLKIKIPASEAWDEEKMEFVTVEEQNLILEHSLKSLSLWESRWKKPFLSENAKTEEEELDYFRCMTVNKEIESYMFKFLSAEQRNEITDYISDSMTATTFLEDKNGGGKSIVTNEIIYYWMTALQIPFECDEWHLNRLLTLIKVCNLKNQPEKKMSKTDLINRYAAINAANRKRLNTKG